MSRSLGCAAVLLLLTTALPTLSSSSSQAFTLHQFGSGSNSTSLYFGSCQSTDNSTTVKLPYNANVSYAGLTVSSPDSLAGKSGWIRFDVANDGSTEDNATLDSNTSSQNANLTTSSWNTYIAAQNLSSGNVSVPILVTSCPPAGGWNISLSSLTVTYAQPTNSSANAPVFSGPISSLSLKQNTTDPSMVYLPYFFSDADGDTLTYNLTKVNAADPGWSNVSGSFASSYLGFAASNSWKGNLSFRVSATDPANQTASSNNITLQVYQNRAPTFGSGNFSAIANQTTPVDLTRTSYVNIYAYFNDPDFNDTLTYSPVPENASDPGWANVSVNVTSVSFVFASSGGWLGNLSFRVRATDTGGAHVDSNIVTLTVRPNQAPVFSGNANDVLVGVNSSMSSSSSYFTEPDSESMTISFEKNNPNGTGWNYVTVTGYNGSLDLSGSFWVYTSGNWSGNVSGFLRARDPLGNAADSNSFTIIVNAPPARNATSDSAMIYLIQGTTNYTAIEVTDYFSDKEGDPFTVIAYVNCCGSNNSTLPVYVVVNGTHLDFVSRDSTFTGMAGGYAYVCDGYSRCVGLLSYNIIVIVQPNRAPVFSGSFPDISVVIGGANLSAIDLSSHWRDADNDALIYGFAAADSNATLWLYTTVSLRGYKVDVRVTTSAYVGDIVVAFYAFDTSYAWAWSNNVTIHIQQRELAPVFSGPIDNFTVAVGQTLTDAFDAADYFSDPNGFPITFTDVNRSVSEGWNYTFLSWNGTRLTVANDGSSPWTGVICFRVRADDVNGTRTFSNTLCTSVVSPPANAPPRPTQPLPPLAAPAGDNNPFLIDLALYFTDDAFPDLIQFAVVKGPEPEWAVVDLSLNGTLLAISFTGPVPPTTLTFEVVVSDAWGSTYRDAAVALTISANPVNHAPQVAGPGPIALELGQRTDVQLQGSDSDRDALTWNFTASVPGIQALFNPVTQRVSLTAQGIADGSSAEILVRVTDGWGATGAASLLLTIWDPARAPLLSLTPLAEITGDVWLNGSVDLGVQPSGAPPPAVRISVDGGGSIFAPLSLGHFALRYPVPLSPGEHSVVASVVDGFARFAEARASFSVPLPLPAVPTITGIVMNGLPPRDVNFGDPLAFGVLTPGALPSGVSVSWYLDGVKVGDRATLTLTDVAPGLHNLTARATNGVDERSYGIAFTVRDQALPPIQTQPGSGLGVLAAGVLLSVAVVGAFVGLTERGRYFLVWAAIGSVFARLKRESLLDHFARGRLYQVISEDPGIHLAELRRRTNIAHGTAIHRLHILERGGYIRVVPAGSLTRFYPTDQALDDDTYGLNDSDRAVLSVVASAPGISPGELSVKLECSPSTVSRSISRLQTLGYVTTEQKGRNTAVFPRPGAQGTDGAGPAWAQPRE